MIKINLMEVIILAKFKKTYILMKSTDHKQALNVKKIKIVCGIKKDGNSVKKNLMLPKDSVRIKIYFQ